MSGVRLLLAAAEPSGDVLGARLIAALRQRLGADLQLVGAGGPRMAAEGLVSAFDIRPLSVLGVFDALRVYPLVRRRARDLGAVAAQFRPGAAVLIDSWGFNLRAARAIRRAAPDVRLIKYVGPQIWATRPGRARTLAGAVDHLLTIHAFDAPMFEAAGLATTFVGNPALAAGAPRGDPMALRRQHGWDEADPVLLIAPGSREGEIARLLPPFLDASLRLRAARPALRLVVLAAAAVADRVRRQVQAEWPADTIIAADAGKSIAAATAALACSGTVTTELGLAGVPMVVAYRLDAPTAFIARRLLRTPWITLMNVAAGRAVVPEFIQEACTGEALAAALSALLDDPVARALQIADQAAALALMAGGIADPAGAAAEAVLKPFGQRASSGL